jgi:hypothetical protein
VVRAPSQNKWRTIAEILSSTHGRKTEAKSADHYFIGPNLEADERIGAECRSDGYIDRVARLT